MSNKTEAGSSSAQSGGAGRTDARSAMATTHNLKGLHGEQGPVDQEEYSEIINSEGELFIIKNSGVAHILSHHGCLLEPGLIATLFYRPPINPGVGPPDVACADATFGAYVSDMAVFEFDKTIGRLMVPWKKRNEAAHKCLDTLDKPCVTEIMMLQPDNLQLAELRRHEEIWGFECKWNIEVVLQENVIFRRYKRMAVFDMDSTLIQQEVIDEIARYVGVEKEVSAITARAMNGELDFEQSLRERAALLKGVPTTVFESLKPNITFTPGARKLTKILKKMGCKIAVLSGGFLPLANYVKEELGLDYAYANTLAVSDDGTHLTGEVIGDIIHAERKAELLEQLAAENGICLKQVIAIGDGANDLPMMAKAGLGVAFNAKPAVQLAAPCRLNSKSLLDVLYLMGITKAEQEELGRLP